MAIDISTLDKLQNKFEKAPDGKWYARTYNGPVIVYEDEIIGYSGGPVPGELQDVFAAQRLQATGKVVTVTTNLAGGVGISVLAASSVPSSDNSMALLGDSITRRNQQNATASFHAEGYFVVANMLIGQKYDVLGVYATSGFTIEQIAATHLPQVIASGAKNCFVLAGTNNASDANAATIFNKLTTLLWQPLRAAGIKICVGTIPPNSLFSTAESAKIATVNDLIRAAKSDYPGLRVADLWLSTVNGATGAPRTGVFGDGVHPAARGAMYFARAIADALNDARAIDTGRMSGGALDPLILSANPLAFGNNATGANGFSLGTGGTGTGPDQWTIQSSNAATTFVSSGNNARSPVDYLDGKAMGVDVTFGADDHYLLMGPLNGADIYLARAWAATTAKVAGTLVHPTSGRAGWQYKCVTSGSTGGSQPTWPTTLGATVTDGTCVWMAIKDTTAGDIYQFEAEIVFSALAGYVCPELRVNFETAAYDNSLRPALIANGVAVPSTDPNAYSPQATLGTAFWDYVPLNKPVVVRSQPIVIPSGIVAHVGPSLRLYGKNGTAATFKVQRLELRRLP